MELKQMMTIEEMSCHMQENTFLLPNRVSIGKYARELGYRVYKPMIDGKVHFYYVNQNVPKQASQQLSK